MNHIYMQRTNDNRYSLKKKSDRLIGALYWFLFFEYDMIRNINSIKKWIDRDPKSEESLHGEFAWAYIAHNNVTVISDFVDDKEEDAKISIKKDAFIQFLNDWREIYLKLPKEVTIYYDGEQFTFDPVY